MEGEGGGGGFVVWVSCCGICGGAGACVWEGLGVCSSGAMEGPAMILFLGPILDLSVCVVK